MLACLPALLWQEHPSLVFLTKLASFAVRNTQEHWPVVFLLYSVSLSLRSWHLLLWKTHRNTGQWLCFSYIVFHSVWKVGVFCCENTQEHHNPVVFLLYSVSRHSLFRLFAQTLSILCHRLMCPSWPNPNLSCSVHQTCVHKYLSNNRRVPQSLYEDSLLHFALQVEICEVN